MVALVAELATVTTTCTINTLTLLCVNCVVLYFGPGRRVLKRYSSVVVIIITFIITNDKFILP